MRIEELKKGFWGFRRTGCSDSSPSKRRPSPQKLAEKDAQMERRSQQDQERIQRLERGEPAASGGAGALPEAAGPDRPGHSGRPGQRRRLKAESQAQEAAARETVRLTLDREMREMERYRENIAALREALHAMTKELDRKADQAEEQVKEVYAAAPIHNLTLFQ